MLLTVGSDGFPLFLGTFHVATLTPNEVQPQGVFSLIRVYDFCNYTFLV